MRALFRTPSGDIQFEGIERDLQMTIDRGIKWIPSIGGPPVAAPMFPGGGFANDTVDMQFTLWTSSENAPGLENLIPAYGNGWGFDLHLLGSATIPAIPGFGVWDGTRWVISKCVLNAPIESLGRKAPRVDLFGYRFDVHFAGGGAYMPSAWYNERGGISPPTPAGVPSVLIKKFAAHQMQDWSLSAKPLPSQIPATGVKHGRRRDASIALDKVPVSDMDLVVGFYRYTGANAFTLAYPNLFGPGSGSSFSVYATGLEISRVGTWWEGKLDVTLAV